MSINNNYDHTIWDMLHIVKIWHEQRSLGKNVYYTFIPNYSNLEATIKFFRRWVEKQASVSKYYLMWKANDPPSHEMQWTKRTYPKRQSQNSMLHSWKGKNYGDWWWSEIRVCRWNDQAEHSGILVQGNTSN